ncbi:MAG: tRNA 2-selenouridine(34) synthase MnmH [Ginsengibacter sp.]
MPIESVDVETFLNLSKLYPILDVRSPSEYAHAHIPGAFSIPLFSDEQRKIIGTAYKRESRKIAVNHGLKYFSERMKIIPREVEELVKNVESKNKTMVSSSTFDSNGDVDKPGILLHCWRGGMRSSTVAWLLSLYGYNIFILKGGYKSYRHWALSQFEYPYPLHILGGYTGSGKTELLLEMQAKGKTIIDLEGLANHKGSAFGALGQQPQPSQEMFENLLAFELSEAIKKKDTIWMEDESNRIGGVHVPNILWDQMRKSKLYFLDIPAEERLKFIVGQYGYFSQESLQDSITKIQKKLGGQETKNAITFLNQDDHYACFEILLTYYDKLYEKALHNRENIQNLLHKIPCESVNAKNAFFETIN